MSPEFRPISLLKVKVLLNDSGCVGEGRRPPALLTVELPTACRHHSRLGCVTAHNELQQKGRDRVRARPRPCRR